VSTLTPRRSILVLVAVVLTLATAACGVDDDKVATGATTTQPGHTTTTKPGGPQISLPDIPPDATESTVPDPTTTSSVPESDATPNGVTPDDLAQQVVGPNITEDQAQCIANDTFAEFDGATIDEMIAANDLGDLGGDIEQRFTAIVQRCVQGG
jgi:hypothetical protein